MAMDMRDPHGGDYKKIWEKSEGQEPLTSQESEDIYLDIKNQTKKERSYTKRFPLLLPTLRVAAALTILLSVWFVWKYSQPPEFLNEATPALITKSTGDTQRRHVRLEDGTRIWLNINSRIEYPSKFEGSKRQIILEGEAFFKVAEDAQRPFIVQSGDLTTKVLGTSFNISAYAGHNTEVAVLTGKVSVGTATHEEAIALLPHQMVVYNKAAQKLEMESFENEDLYTSWFTEDLAFDNEKLATVIKILNKKYNTDIKVSNARLNHCLLKARFSNEPLEKVLEVIGTATNAKIIMEKDRIMIQGKGCDP